jgi:toxin ParE1/3/4
MDYKIRWSKKAVSKLDEICSYIAIDSPYYASITAKKILDSIELLEQFPNLGRIVPEFNQSNIRELIYQNYRIVYKLKENIIEISTISHSAKKDLDI